MRDTIIQTSEGQTKLAEGSKLWRRIKVLPASIVNSTDPGTIEDVETPTWLFAGKTPEDILRNKLLIIISGADGESITEAEDLSEYAAELGFHSIRLPASSFELLQKHSYQWEQKVADLLEQLDMANPELGWNTYFNNGELVLEHVVLSQTTYPLPASVVANRIQALLAVA